jgi:hypothetical protein
MSRRAVAESGTTEEPCFKDVIPLGAVSLILTVRGVMTG